MLFGNLTAADLLSTTAAVLQGLGVVLILFFVTLPLSMLIGFLMTLCVNSRIALLRWLLNVYIYVVRGTPLMLQLFFVYFGFPLIGKQLVAAGLLSDAAGKLLILSGLASALLTYVFNYAAYFAEIFRGGLLAVDRGQYEAAKVLGLNRVQTTVKVILPQMFRVALPSITNESITLMKDTALVFSISVPEVMHYTKVAVSRTGTLFPFVVAAIVYLVLNTVLQFGLSRLEKRMKI